ncbi:MAG TPA: hypothetical protein VK821_08495 [Dehalococcoidia bacterium]|nr:hypothetical protein [Dehalococcoidia bacterium]
MAFEFGFDVLRTDVEPVDAEDEPEEDDEELPTYELMASSGDVSAHIFVDRDDMSWLIREIESAEDAEGARPGGPWEPQLPLMRGFFFHPRIRFAGGEVLAPGQLDDEGEPIEFWEVRIEDEEGSEVILRLSDTVLRGLLRQLREALARAV